MLFFKLYFFRRNVNNGTDSHDIMIHTGMRLSKALGCISRVTHSCRVFLSTEATKKFTSKLTNRSLLRVHGQDSSKVVAFWFGTINLRTLNLALVHVFVSPEIFRSLLFSFSVF